MPNLVENELRTADRHVKSVLALRISGTQAGMQQHMMPTITSVTPEKIYQSRARINGEC